MSSIIAPSRIAETDFSRFPRAQSWYRRWLHPVPLKPESLFVANLGRNWLHHRMTGAEVSAVFEANQYEVGLGTAYGLVVVEAEAGIASWFRKLLPDPFAITERHGLVMNYYRYDGTPFDNPFPSGFGHSVFTIHYRNVVLAPDTPQLHRRILHLAEIGSRFDPSVIPEMKREASEWKRARREAQGLHFSGA